MANAFRWCGSSRECTRVLVQTALQLARQRAVQFVLKLSRVIRSPGVARSVTVIGPNVPPDCCGVGVSFGTFPGSRCHGRDVGVVPPKVLHQFQWWSCSVAYGGPWHPALRADVAKIRGRRAAQSCGFSAEQGRQARSLCSPSPAGARCPEEVPAEQAEASLGTEWIGVLWRSVSSSLLAAHAATRALKPGGVRHGRDGAKGREEPCRTASHEVAAVRRPRL